MACDCLVAFSLWPLLLVFEHTQTDLQSALVPRLPPAHVIFFLSACTIYQRMEGAISVILRAGARDQYL